MFCSSEQTLCADTPEQCFLFIEICQEKRLLTETNNFLSVHLSEAKASDSGSLENKNKNETVGELPSVYAFATFFGT